MENNTDWKSELEQWVDIAPSGARVMNCYPETIEAIIERAIATAIAATEERVGIKQGTLYGYDLVLMAPKEAVGDVINEKTLERHVNTEKNRAISERNGYDNGCTTPSQAVAQERARLREEVVKLLATDVQITLGDLQHPPRFYEGYNTALADVLALLR